SYEENRARPPISFLIALSDYSKITMDTLIKKNVNELEY
ncbi:MAG: XRE family transcriptional regulator, partial [Lutibacter sp.]|nr:XRE family transcriptional regulator [Lutibacter sp.]